MSDRMPFKPFNVGVKLMDGRFAGHMNVYPMEWPAPDRIVCFELAGQVAVADAEHLDEALELDDDAALYVKVSESKLDADDPMLRSVMVRGAAYRAEGEDG